MKQQCLHSLQNNEWVSISCAAEMQKMINSIKHSIQSTCQSRSFTDFCSWEAFRKQTTERFQSHQSIITVSDRHHSQMLWEWKHKNSDQSLTRQWTWFEEVEDERAQWEEVVLQSSSYQ